MRNGQVLDAMYGDERGLIEQAHRNPDLGLALSGGGIRSACFATGVLQALDELGILRHVGYLSTVSGGGFAGGWYLTHPQAFQPGSIDLLHLERNGHYLTTGHSSRSGLELTGMLAKDALLWPLAVLGNEALNLQLNVNGVRTDYLRAIHRTFFYDEPFVDPGDPAVLGTWCPLTPCREPSWTLADLAPDCHRPFWIVNAHQILDADDDSRFRSRSGEAFEITPLRAGSDAVGYVRVPDPTDGCARPEHFWMSPEVAVAISAAAADSESLKQGLAPSTLLYLANADLGYFVPGWGPGWVQGDPHSLRCLLAWCVTAPFPVHRILMPLAELVTGRHPSIDDGHRFRTDGRYWGLTDGGHFENLGLYALVRRGCRLILVVDASEDEAVNGWDGLDAAGRVRAFGDLRHAMQLIESDFGAVLEPDFAAFRPRVATSDGNEPAQHGPVFQARILNLPLPPRDGHQEREPVVVIVIKAAFKAPLDDPGLPAAIALEALEDRRFPHRKTFGSPSAQLYSERSVAAYRLHGYRTVMAQRQLFERYVPTKGAIAGAPARP